MRTWIEKLKDCSKEELQTILDRQKDEIKILERDLRIIEEILETKQSATMPWIESIQHQLGLQDKKGGKIGEGLSKALAPLKEDYERRNE